MSADRHAAVGTWPLSLAHQGNDDGDNDEDGEVEGESECETCDGTSSRSAAPAAETR